MLVFGVQNYLEFKLFQGRFDTDPASVHLANLSWLLLRVMQL